MTKELSGTVQLISQSLTADYQIQIALLSRCYLIGLFYTHKHGVLNDDSRYDDSSDLHMRHSTARNDPLRDCIPLKDILLVFWSSRAPKIRRKELEQNSICSSCK